MRRTGGGFRQVRGVHSFLQDYGDLVNATLTKFSSIQVEFQTQLVLPVASVVFHGLGVVRSRQIQNLRLAQRMDRAVVDGWDVASGKE